MQLMENAFSDAPTFSCLVESSPPYKTKTARLHSCNFLFVLPILRNWKRDISVLQTGFRWDIVKVVLNKFSILPSEFLKMRRIVEKLYSIRFKFIFLNRKYLRNSDAVKDIFIYFFVKKSLRSFQT